MYTSLFPLPHPDDVDAELLQWVERENSPHKVAAHHAQQFRVDGDVVHLVMIADDPHECGTTELLFAMASSKRTWLNWIPMPTEAITHLANEIGGDHTQGARHGEIAISVSAAEPASAVIACRRVAGQIEINTIEFPEPDIRLPLQPGRYAVWRYDGDNPVPALSEPSAAAVHLLLEVGDQPWHSPFNGYVQAAPLGDLPLDDLLGLLAHPPEPPDTERWQILAQSTPTYWYRFLQPWVCLGILHHAKNEPWATSTRREVLVNLAFGVEDWVSDAALFALVTAAYRERDLREEVRQLVRTRLDAAVAASRAVSIRESLARLMVVTPGCRDDDRGVAKAALAQPAEDDEELGEIKDSRQ